MKRGLAIVGVVAAVLSTGCRRQVRHRRPATTTTVMVLPSPGSPDWPKDTAAARELTPEAFESEFVDDPEEPIDPKMKALIAEALRRGENDPPVEFGPTPEK